MITPHRLSSGSTVATRREPLSSDPLEVTSRQGVDRGFIPPDAAMPGPLGRTYPLDGTSDSSAGGDSVFGGGDSQNQDRI